MSSKNMIVPLEKSIRQYWNYPALADYRGQVFSYADTARQILIFHSLFKKNHVRRGDKIALIGRNSARWAMVYLAVFSYGAVIVPILPDFHSEDIQHLIHHSESVLAFSSGEIYDQLNESAFKGVEAVLSLDDFSTLYHRKKYFDALKEEAYKEGEERFKTIGSANFVFQTAVEDSDAAALIYTSGTTGFLKGFAALPVAHGQCGVCRKYPP